uniref:SAM domain-containing protein n=2 Tax=Caenorhabditis tropicalis TaxID=1561998 RepID=A0A1I7TQT1_9PELO
MHILPFGLLNFPPRDPSLMMRLTHNTSCISLSAMEQQPSGSSATIFPPPVQRLRRTPAAPLEDQILMNLQNVTIFSPNDFDLASLGVPSMVMNGNPWQPNTLSFGTASTNGFTGSDTSSAPMSPVSSPGPRKHNGQGNGYHQQATTQRFYKNPAHSNHFRTNRTNGVHHQNGYQHNQNGNRASGYNNMSNNQSTGAPMSRTYRAGDEHKPGMRDLGYWLKKLRLHKYAPLFQDMSYRQLLSLNSAVLEKMRVTNGARKKIAQSIEKLHERPGLLRSLEQKLKNGTQCVRCAICSVRQLLWSPFIKYEGFGTRKTSPEIIDGFNVPSQMISDDNLPALIFRVIETLNNMVFPLRKGILDLEDEYQLTMFHMYESVMKNEAFTPAQQRRAFAMKKNARNYANPEEIRRHRMGMVSSSQCEGCHHAEVVNRERLMELQDRHLKLTRGDLIGLPSYSACSAILDLVNPDPNARHEFNVPPVSPAQRIQKRPAVNEDEWSGSPKITASPTDSIIFESLILPQIQSTNFWENVENIWGDDGDKPSTSFRFPLYRRPEEMEVEQAKEEVETTDGDFSFLQMVSDEQPAKEPSLSDFNFPESVASSKKANSTGSGYSSSDSESSMSQPKYGINQVLCSTAFQCL